MRICSNPNCGKEYKGRREGKFCTRACANRAQNKIEYDVESFVKHDYKFDGQQYLFSVNDQFVSIDKDRWAGMVADYSAEGGNLTLYQTAQKYGIPRKILEVCFRKYGHFKARPPATREEIKDAEDTEDFEPLYERAIEVAELGFNIKLVDRKRKAAEDQNKELKQELAERGNLADEMRLLVAELADELPKAKNIKKTTKKSPRIKQVHAPLFDTHIGLTSQLKGDWAVTEFNSQVAWDMIHVHGRDLRRMIEERGGRVEVAHLTHGGDMFHAPMGKTVSGRPLQRELPDRILMRETVLAFKRQIEAVRPVADHIRILGVPGNHGHVFDEFLIDFLHLHYSETEDVEVVDGFGARGYFLSGDSLHVLDHGTTFSSAGSTSTMATAERVSRRIAGNDYARANRIYYYIGHLHHREGKSQAHLEIIRVPTIAGANDYEEFLGFVNDSMTDVYFLDEKGRIKDIERMFMSDLI